MDAYSIHSNESARMIQYMLEKMELGTRPVPPQGTKPNAWTDADRELVRTLYPIGGTPEVRKHLPNRTVRAIQEQAALMHVSAPGRWSAEQDACIREHYTLQGGEAVAKMTGRTTFAVRRRAAILDVPADRHLSGKRKYKAQVNKPNPPKEKKFKPLTVMRARDKRPKVVPLQGEVDLSKAVYTIAEPFVDRRFMPDGPVASVVNPEQCRAWARTVR